MRPGDKVLSVTGKPYDTMEDVIGKSKKDIGSLKNFGIEFEYVELESDKSRYFDKIKNKLKSKFKAVYIQRSRGYSLRPSLSSEYIGELVSLVKEVDPEIITIVDNCYGEFVEVKEPSEFGSDLIVGSLIKNPGGGISPSGGYIAGKKHLINLCSNRFTAPGIGKEIGANASGYRDLFMGIYNAPGAVSQALKTAVFASAIFEILGYEVSPKYNDKRFDIVQSITLKSSQALIGFCRGIQGKSPIDSFVVPEPWDMPGYGDKVIMAAGNFISGSSIELSADGPLRDPYVVWMQGGTCFYTSKIGIMNAAQNVSSYTV